MKENAILLELLSELVKETIRLSNEMRRIRTKLDTELYKIGTKYDLVSNEILVCKNKFKNSVRSYNSRPRSCEQKSNLTKCNSDIVIDFN